MHWNTEQTRILITLEARRHPAVFLTCIEHLLHASKTTRILILTSASAKPALISTLQAAIRKNESQLFTEYFPRCSSLALPHDTQTRVCLSTMRELQLQQLEQAPDLSVQFDIIIVYDLPAHLSPIWKRTIEKLEPSSLIAFCATPMPAVIEWFENTNRGEEKEKGTITHWSMPL